jgi:hypothetical protein
VPRRRPLSAWVRPGTLIKVVAAGVPLVATAVGLVFTLWPSLKPSDPPELKAASLEIRRVDHPVSFGQYLRRAELPTTGQTRAQLARVGALVQFDLAMQGYKGARLPLRWVLIDARNGDVVSQSKNVLFEPLADDDRVSWQEWVAIPRPGREYYVLLHLYDPGGKVPLATRESKPFRG